MKLIHIEISKCEDCPFFGYSDYYGEHTCTFFDRAELIFYNDYRDKDNNGIIWVMCLLEEKV